MHGFLVAGSFIIINPGNPAPHFKPIIKLNADQVIDLEFNDGVFYRGDGFHTCEGDVGNPPTQLIIEMMFGNQTIFQMVPEADIAFLLPNDLLTLSTRLK
jgi:hypothetical protein